MTLPHISQAPDHITRQLRAAEAHAEKNGSHTLHGPAALALRMGYRYFDGDPDTPYLDELRRIVASGDKPAEVAYRMAHRGAVDAEAKLSTWWFSTPVQRRLAGPTNEECAAAGRAAVDAAELERAIEVRAQEILEEKRQRELEAALAKARKELS